MSFLTDIKTKTSIAKEKELEKRSKLCKSVISQIKKEIEARANIAETSFTWKPSSADESRIFTMVETYFKNEGFAVKAESEYFSSSSFCECGYQPNRIIILKISWEE